MNQHPDGPPPVGLFQPDTLPGPGLSTPELLTKLEQADPGLARRVEAQRIERGALGTQLYRARLGNGLTQSELAERSGVRQPDISEIERGGGNPTRTTLEKLGVALGVDFSVGASSAA